MRHEDELADGLRRSSASSSASIPSSSTFSPSRFQRLSLSSRRRSSASKQIEQDTWGPLGLHVIHSPTEALVEIIFVHGLRGGSIKTWCKGDDLRCFWPCEWLPQDPDLRDARIHSFGYNADWADTKESELDIHDFGRALLAELRTSPVLRQDKDTPILLVGHSMGGLVIKKAYLLAQQDARSSDLARRIQCMFFLATPHRGSDSAKLLNNVLRAASWLSGRNYVSDLARNSLSLQIISDEFRNFADEMQLWSFYETLKTKIGPTTSTLVVDRDSAVMGYKNETAQPINADHRSICKYDSTIDPNYILMRNCLKKAIDDVLADVPDVDPEDPQHAIDDLEYYLGITYYAEDDLANLEAARAPHTCEWLLEEAPFQKWLSSTDNVSMFWLNGTLGMGKSVITAHTASHLQSSGYDVALHFFKSGRKDQRTVSSMLRHLAFQLAILHPAIRQRLHALHANNVQLDKDDEQTIWRKLFVNEILRTTTDSPQAWVFDGIDECSEPARLFALIRTIDPAFQLRIFVSSRNLASLERPFRSLQYSVHTRQIQVEDTIDDIRVYIHESCESMAMSIDNPGELADRMLRKAGGSFLWAKLAFEELEQTYSEESMMEILNDIPYGMAALYSRVLDTMALNTREIKLTRAILEWAVCSIRSLHVNEMQAALKLDINVSVPNMERSIQGLCGQLIRVENQGRIHLLHATARDFILEQQDHENFVIEPSLTHGRLAKVCLAYLCEDDLRPPRSRIASSRLNIISNFADYAVVAWSDHLTATSSEDNALFKLLHRFFATNVLTWIEFVAYHKKNLWHVTKAAISLRKYLDRRAKHVSPLGLEYAALDKWATDLLRVVAKFGQQLLEEPTAIHFVIPPLCPTGSRIYQQHGTKKGHFELVGFSNDIWDDCICYIDYRDTRATSLASSDNLFAIGFRSGQVVLYHRTTCQQKIIIDHGELVRHIQFDHKGATLATSSNKNLTLWSVDGELLWTNPHKDPPMELRFSPDDNLLAAVTKASSFECWHSKHGIPKLLNPHTDQNPVAIRQNSRQAILSCAISPDMKIVALAYRGRPLQLWSLYDDVQLGLCQKEALSIGKVLFNPNASIEMLAVTYQDGELAIFDTWTQHEVVSVAGEAYTLAASPDGRTLASGDMLGTIKLWDFETLQLLYCIKSPDYEIKSLAFSGDALRLYDIRDHKSKVWEPSALVRKPTGEESSVSDSVSMIDPPLPVGSYGETIEITVLVPPIDLPAVFVGKDDGTVSAYNTQTGECEGLLYSHRRDVLVTHMACNSVQCRIATADASSTILIWQLGVSRRQSMKSTSKLAEVHIIGGIHDLFFTPDGGHLIVLGHSENVTIILGDKALATFRQNDLPLHNASMGTNFQWLHGKDDHECVLVKSTSNHLRLYRSDRDFQQFRVLAACTMMLAPGKHVQGVMYRIAIESSGTWFVAEAQQSDHQGVRRSLLLIYRLSSILELSSADNAASHMESPPTLIFPVVSIPATKFKQYLGFFREKLMFLDNNLWVCSLDMSVHANEQATTSLSTNRSLILAKRNPYARHFLIPYEFVGGSQEIPGCVTSDGNICFTRAGELGIVRNGLDKAF